MRRQDRPLEYPSTPIHKLTTFRTRFGDEGLTVIPATKSRLTDRDRRVVELESLGYTLSQTFVFPDQPKYSGGIGNIHIVPADTEQLAVNGILTTLATQRITAAVEEYGAKNVAVCRSMRLPPIEDSIYQPHEYMALYVRNTLT
jgi:hypothetical protein